MYIEEVGQAIAGGVVKDECYRVLTVFTNICCDCDWDVIVESLKAERGRSECHVFPVEVEKRQ